VHYLLRLTRPLSTRWFPEVNNRLRGPLPTAGSTKPAWTSNPLGPAPSAGASRGYAEQGR